VEEADKARRAKEDKKGERSAEEQAERDRLLGEYGYDSDPVDEEGNPLPPEEGGGGEGESSVSSACLLRWHIPLPRVMCLYLPVCVSCVERDFDLMVVVLVAGHGVQQAKSEIQRGSPPGNVSRVLGYFTAAKRKVSLSLLIFLASRPFFPPLPLRRGALAQFSSRVSQPPIRLISRPFSTIPLVSRVTDVSFHAC